MARSQSQPSSFQTLSRAVIMLGTLVVGGLAWCVYGPPPERLAPILNEASRLVNEALARDGSPTPDTDRDNLTAWDDPQAAFAALDAVVADGEAWPSAVAPAIATPSTTSPEDQLRQLGAHEVAVDAWGQSGLYRCRCVVPVAGSTDFLRNFDAVEPTAEQAIERVASDVRAWQLGQ